MSCSQDWLQRDRARTIASSVAPKSRQCLLLFSQCNLNMTFSIYAADRVCFCLALEAATSAESLCRVVAHDLLASADLLH